MSRCILFILIIFCLKGYSQIETTLLSQQILKVKSIVSVEDQNTLTYIDFQNALHKQDPDNNLSYSNIQLGTIESANAFNNLKLNLFYKDFNTIILLDNRLAEIYRLNLNDLIPYRNISHISTGYDNTLWMFNTDLQQLELYDYKSDKIRVTTIPVESMVLDLKSDYNYVWLLTEKFLYKYNYQGSLVSKLSNSDFISLDIDDENIILTDGNQLHYLNKNSDDLIAVDLPDLLIKQFLLANETLYIYDGEILYRFQLKIK